MNSNPNNESLIFKIPGIEYDLTTRWEKGIPHHPKSIHLYKRIEELDFKLNSDDFGFKSGGDGDNGEQLMFLLDVYFEEIEQLEKDY